MKYKYSATTNAFYPYAMEDEYRAAGVWPTDGVDIEEGTFASFQNPPAGKVRVAGPDGHPAWADTPSPTKEQLIASAHEQKASLINAANAYVNSKQWPGKAALGRLKGNELAQYNLWLDYLDALEAIDTSTAPDIAWPAYPAQ